MIKLATSLGFRKFVPKYCANTAQFWDIEKVALSSGESILMMSSIIQLMTLEIFHLHIHQIMRLLPTK